MRLPNSGWKKIKRRKFKYSITLSPKYICICYIENRDKPPYSYQQETFFTVKNSCLQVFFGLKVTVEHREYITVEYIVPLFLERSLLTTHLEKSGSELLYPSCFQVLKSVLAATGNSQYGCTALP